jgi:hypothetical protein
LLRRDIDIFGGGVLVSIGYNPSDADEVVNDATIRREIDFCKRWRLSTFIKVNVFAAVSSKPARLAEMDDPVGLLADDAIKLALTFCQLRGGVALATWGVPKGMAATRRLAAERFRQIRDFGFPLQALRVTASGHPEHPLYLPSTVVPRPWAVENGLGS